MRLEQNANKILGAEDIFGVSVDDPDHFLCRTSSPDSQSYNNVIGPAEKVTHTSDGQCSGQDDTDPRSGMDTEEDDMSSNHSGRDMEDDEGSQHSGREMEVVRPQMHHTLQAQFTRTRGDFNISKYVVIDRETHKLDAEVLRAFLGKAVSEKVFEKCYPLRVHAYQFICIQYTNGY